MLNTISAMLSCAQEMGKKGQESEEGISPLLIIIMFILFLIIMFFIIRSTVGGILK